MTNPMYDDYPVTQNNAPSMPMAQSYGMVDSPAIAREVAQIQSAMIIAKRFPRNEEESIKKIERACSREKLANSAIYDYGKGGTQVTGASINLARAVATAWGNIKFGFEETECVDNVSTVRTYAYDLESNSLEERNFKVPHIRHTRQGDYLLTDPREIYELVANQAARRERACILGVVPSDVIDYAMDVCNKTRNSKVKITPESLENLTNAFASFGVTKLQIEDFIQRNISSITTTQYLRLRDIFQALKDGMASPSNYFKDVAEIKREVSKEEEKKQTAETVAETVEEVTSAAEQKSEELSFNF